MCIVCVIWVLGFIGWIGVFGLGPREQAHIVGDPGRESGRDGFGWVL